MLLDTPLAEHFLDFYAVSPNSKAFRPVEYLFVAEVFRRRSSYIALEHDDRLVPIAPEPLHAQQLLFLA